MANENTINLTPTDLRRYDELYDEDYSKYLDHLAAKNEEEGERRLAEQEEAHANGVYTEEECREYGRSLMLDTAYRKGLSIDQLNARVELGRI